MDDYIEPVVPIQPINHLKLWTSWQHSANTKILNFPRFHAELCRHAGNAGDRVII